MSNHHKNYSGLPHFGHLMNSIMGLLHQCRQAAFINGIQLIKNLILRCINNNPITITKCYLIKCPMQNYKKKLNQQKKDTLKNLNHVLFRFFLHLKQIAQLLLFVVNS